MDGVVRRSAALLVVGSTLLVSACDRQERRQLEGPYAKVAADAIPRIEKVTGLTFKADPKIEQRSKDEVRSFLERRFREELPDEEIAGTRTAYLRLGLIPDTLDLRAFMLDLLTEQVVGYYDPSTKVLYVVKEAAPEQVSTIISHELVHALQDQYMSLDSLQHLRGDNDRQVAAQAVIEGQATIVQIQAALGGADLATAFPGGWDRVREVIRESSSAMPVFATAPRIIQETLIFPYLSGADFVRTYQQLRPGEAPYADLPRSTEQIMHTRAYFNDRDTPTQVTLPAPRIGRSRYQNNLGEFETRLFLYEHIRDQGAAVRGAAGWDGDRYMVVATPRGDALVWVTVWDTPVDAAEFTEAVDRALGRRFARERVRDVEGGRVYPAGEREVTVWGGDVGGKAVVVYTDAPSGTGQLVAPPSIKLQ
ncbi:MAG TPA: hypothetical protein VFB46_15795 [Gemmatimonadaceae bacterium]|nr:hypothetical protein [Gemmatimonadaceae bacterium]